MEEMGDEHHPLMGPRGGDELPLTSGSRCAMSLDKYPAFLSLLMCPSVTEEAIHLPPAPNMFGVFLRRRCELGRWISSAQEWIGREVEGVGKKEESLSIYKGDRNCVPPHLPGKTRLFPKRRD